MFIVIETETDGCFSDKDWKVCGVFNKIQDASKFAWASTLLPCVRDHHVKYWCDPSKLAKQRRHQYRTYGAEYQILDWDMSTNMPNGTWYLETKQLFLELGEGGDAKFRETVADFSDMLKTYVPGKLWNQFMSFEKHDKV
jgi:hypothetical protein